MHEIRVTIPPEAVSEAARIALAAGIEQVTVTEVAIYGVEGSRRLVSVETSTPKHARSSMPPGFSDIFQD
jgi:hypothetical protein